MTIQVKSSNSPDLISLEISQQEQEKLRKIASLKGISINEFLTQIILNETKKIDNSLIIEEINLSEKDWEIVTSAIENPPEINSKLKQAIEQYKEQYK